MKKYLFLIFMLFISKNLCSCQENKSHQPSQIDLERRNEMDRKYADWGTFMSRIYGFTVRFPTEYMNIAENGPVPLPEKIIRRKKGTIFYGQEMRLYSVTFSDRMKPVFAITVYKNPDNLELKEFAIKTVELNGLYKEKDIKTEWTTIHNKKAIKTIFKNKVGGYDGTVTPTFVKSENYIIGIHIYRSVSRLGYKKFYKKLINGIDLFKME